MLKLYFSPSSSSLATHIALIESGAAHELAIPGKARQHCRLAAQDAKVIICRFPASAGKLVGGSLEALRISS
jgi:hypothetical protein